MMSLNTKTTLKLENGKLAKQKGKLVCHHRQLRNNMSSLELLQLPMRQRLKLITVHEIWKFKKKFLLQLYIEGGR